MRQKKTEAFFFSKQETFWEIAVVSVAIHKYNDIHYSGVIINMLPLCTCTSTSQQLHDGIIMEALSFGSLTPPKTMKTQNQDRKQYNPKFPRLLEEETVLQQQL